MRGKRKAAYWDDEFLVSLLTGQNPPPDFPDSDEIAEVFDASEGGAVAVPTGVSVRLVLRMLKTKLRIGSG